MSKRLAVFDAIIAKGTTDPFVFYARAMELRSLERMADALAAFEGAIASFPHYVPSYLMAAQVARAVGDFDRARALLRAGIEAARRAGDAHAASELDAELASLD